MDFLEIAKNIKNFPVCLEIEKNIGLLYDLDKKVTWKTGLSGH